MLDLGNLVRAEQEFELDGKRYVVVEASGKAQSNHYDQIIKIAKPDPATGKPTSVTGLSDVQPTLVADCLYLVTEEGRKPVPLKDVKELPARVISRLYDWIKDVSGLVNEKDSKEDPDPKKL